MLFSTIMVEKGQQNWPEKNRIDWRHNCITKNQGRVAFDKALQNDMTKLSKENPQIQSPYTLTIGDEIKPFSANADHLFHDAVSILLVMHPRKDEIFLWNWDTHQTNQPQPGNREWTALGCSHSVCDGIEEIKEDRQSIYHNGEVIF